MTPYLAVAWIDAVNAASQVGTFVIVASTAVAAIAQLRHLRASNELQALLRLTEQLREPALQRAFRFVQTELDARLTDPSFRDELTSLGYVDSRLHPEMDACNWFDTAGALVKNGLIVEGTFLDLFSRLVNYYWKRLEPVVALLRRERGPGQYENFEYLAALAQRWRARHPAGNYPARLARIRIADPWLEAVQPGSSATRL